MNREDSTALTTEDVHWPPGPASPRLGAGELHLWTAALDSVPSGAAEGGLLSRDERRRAERYRREHDRIRYRATRVVLRTLLAAYTGTEPAELRFRQSDHGKPILSGPGERPGPFFNLSRSGGLVVVAISVPAPVGVDVERVRSLPDADRIARRFFTRVEADALERDDSSGSDRRFFRIWTRKEAVVKALGQGLSLPLDSFSVPTEPNLQEGPVRWTSERGNEKTWLLREIAPAPGWIGAVSARGWSHEPETWQWTV